MTTFGDRVFQFGGTPVGGDGLIGLLGDGRVIYVDTGLGNDGNTGKAPDKAVATLSQAQSLAQSNRGDVIVIMPGNYSHTAVLNITKDDLQFVAATGGGTKSHRTTVLIDADSSYTTGPVIRITTANESAWYGIAFGSRSAGTGDGNVAGSAFCMGDATTNTGQSNHVEGCYFPAHQNSDTLLYMASGSRSSIINNVFGGLASGSVHGITMTGSAGSSANIIIKGNVFKRLTTGIQLGDGGARSAMQDHLFMENVFLDGITNAFNLTAAQAASRCLIAGNYFNGAIDSTDNFTGSITGNSRANLKTDGYVLSGNHYDLDTGS